MEAVRVVRSGLLDKVKQSLTAAGIDYVELAGIQPNPTDPRCTKVSN